MKKWNEDRGKEVNVNFAKGFTQHKGHSFPQKNILKDHTRILTKEMEKSEYIG